MNPMLKPQGAVVKQVKVLNLDPVKAKALCRDTEGFTIEASLSIHRTGILPKVGQLWLVDRELTSWSMRALLDSSPVNPALTFATADERDLWLTDPAPGIQVWLEDSARFWVSTSGGWVPLAANALVDSPWIPLTGMGTLVNPGHGATASYRSTGGQVHLRGRLAKPDNSAIADATVLGVLPSGLRPVGAVAGGDGQCQGSTGRASTVRIEIPLTGQLTLFDQFTTRPTWIGLDGISFWLD